MAIRWKIRFMSLLGTSYEADIYDSSYTGTATELTGGAQPFVTRELDDEDLYTPIRTQSGYLRFIVENASIVSQIQPVKATDRPVILKSGNNVVWVGFLRPEQYSQPWMATPYEIELPLMSVMEAMQGVEFTQSEGYVSFFSMVQTVSSYLPIDIYITAPSETPVKDVFVQNNNFREFLTIAERAERDTQNIYECVSIYEVIEAFCKYFGFSLHEYAGSFFCVATTADDSLHYLDIEPNGNTRESQWGSNTLQWMTICGADNLLDYSKVYRRIKGEFDTNKDKMEKVFDIDEFFKQFSVQGAYPTTAPRNLLFYGNAEIQPYKNGVQKTEWISDSTLSDSGGQIIRKPDARLNAVERAGATWNDEFFVKSVKTKASTPESAIKFNIPNYIYLNSGEYAALNIDGSVLPWFDVTQGEGFIKKLHCKVRIGNYWLRVVEQSGYLPRYEWTTTESACYLMVDESGNLTAYGAQYTLDYRAEAEMDHISGFAIDMPSGLSAGYYSVYFELLANAEPTADFGDYSSIVYLISGLTIRVLRGTNSVSQPTAEFDKNTVIRKTNGLYADDYTIGCTITSKRGVQYGAGVVLDENHAYVSTKYDTLGVERRAAVMNKSREIISVKVRKNIQPIDYVTNNQVRYAVISQSIDWRDDTNEIRIINLS